MKLKRFNTDCKSFRNFDDAIHRESTRRSYHYNLYEFMRFAKLTDYDVHAAKEFVFSEDKEGIEIKISEYNEKNSV